VINIPFIVIFSFYCSKFINYLYYRYVWEWKHQCT
jgi:hypothetical protein